MAGRLAGKTALITAAGQGIGAATARAFATTSFVRACGQLSKLNKPPIKSV